MIQWSGATGNEVSVAMQVLEASSRIMMNAREMDYGKDQVKAGEKESYSSLACSLKGTVFS